MRISDWSSDVCSSDLYPDLDIRIDLPAALARAAVPAFLLQPLVENAVKHGAGTVGAGDAWIAIAAREDRGQLNVVVENSCSSSASRPGISGMHTGPRTVRDRLSNRFGAAATLLTVPPHASCFRSNPHLLLGYARGRKRLWKKTWCGKGVRV